MGFGLVIGFTEHLQIVTKSNYSAIISSSLRDVLSLLSLLCVRRLSGNGFQLLCSRLHDLAGCRLSHNSPTNSLH
jgi:hypothetical protein